MNYKQKILAFVQLASHLQQKESSELQALYQLAWEKNRWFIPENIQLSIEAICENFLQQERLENWLNAYPESPPSSKKIGVVMAGNIPLVGFQDFLNVLMSGHTLLAKLSSEDDILLKGITKILCAIEPAFEEKIRFVDKINEADVYLATGSNNSARYFEYYFSKKPHIIRKNRNSCAVLTGKESKDELAQLGDDLFRYFGLGCRNVSKLYIPEGYSFANLFEANQHWQKLVEYNKYANNYDYNKAIYLMNQIPFFDNGFAILKEDKALASPVGVVFYETYATMEEVRRETHQLKDQIQVIVSKDAWFPGSIPLGQSQEPSLCDYADGVDVMEFLRQLN